MVGAEDGWNVYALPELSVNTLTGPAADDDVFHAQVERFWATESFGCAKGYAEPVGEDEARSTSARDHYLPHHGMVSPNKFYLGVVFDTGATYCRLSLNANLLEGADLTSTFVRVLMTFRSGNIVISADVKNMFHQVKIPRRDQDSVRLLWTQSLD